MNSLSEPQRSKALERYQILQPFLEGRCTLPQAIEPHGLPVRTARRWVSRYRTMGLTGLVRASRRDKGIRKILSDKEIQLIEGLALQKPPPTKATIFRRVQDWAKQENQSCPSYTTVSNIIDGLDPGLMTLAHKGTKAYKDVFDLLHRQEADGPNAIWQADHTQLDIWLRDAKGHPVRPWLTVIMDDYSRAIAGYYLFLGAPSALQTALALRQAIWRKDNPDWLVFGIPAVLYTDHGSDFTSQHIEQVCADLKIRLIFSQVAQPRGRGKIERFFLTVNQMLLSQLADYTPRGTRPPEVPKLSLSDFTREFECFLHDYHCRSHGEIKEQPQERWAKGGFIPHILESLESLDLLLLTVVKARKVHQDGIRFQGFRYIDLVLASYIGESVTIRYDPRDMAEIRVYHNNQFLCRAICPELADTTLSLKDIEAARNQRRRDLKKQLKERKSLVDTMLQKKPITLDQAPPVVTEPKAQSTVSKTPLKRYHHE